MLPAAKRRLSRLESLPAELLEQILLHSLNVNLPFASPYLGFVLSTIRMSTKLNILSECLPDDSALGEPSRTFWAGNVSDTNKVIGELQSRILACRWVTWDVFRLCMERSFVRALIRVFRDGHYLWPEGLRVTDDQSPRSSVSRCGGAPVQESVVNDFVHDCVDISMRRLRPNDDYTARKVKNVAITSSLETYSSGSNVDDTPSASVGIDLLKGWFVLRGIHGIDGILCKLPDCYSKIMPSHFEPIIPVKLLHGPWTEDRLSFLYTLNESGARIKPANSTQVEIAKKGLTEAIRDDNYRAVHLITKLWDTSSVLSATDKEGRSLCITLDAEHLHIAVVERGCRKKIVQRLLWAMPSFVNLTDGLVVQWAKAKREQGDIVGQWLLNQLAEWAADERKKVFDKFWTSFGRDRSFEL